MYLATSHGAYQYLRAHFQIILASILSSGKDPQWQLLSERKDDEGGRLVSTKAALLLCFIYSDSSLNFLCEKGSTTDRKIIDVTELRSLDEFQETWLFWSHEATPAWIPKGSGCLTLWGTDHCIYFSLELELRETKARFQPWNHLPNRFMNRSWLPHWLWCSRWSPEWLAQCDAIRWQQSPVTSVILEGSSYGASSCRDIWNTIN